MADGGPIATEIVGSVAEAAAAAEAHPIYTFANTLSAAESLAAAEAYSASLYVMADWSWNASKGAAMNDKAQNKVGSGGGGDVAAPAAGGAGRSNELLPGVEDPVFHVGFSILAMLAWNQGNLAFALALFGVAFPPIAGVVNWARFANGRAWATLHTNEGERICLILIIACGVGRKLVASHTSVCDEPEKGGKPRAYLGVGGLGGCLGALNWRSSGGVISMLLRGLRAQQEAQAAEAEAGAGGGGGGSSGDATAALSAADVEAMVNLGARERGACCGFFPRPSAQSSHSLHTHTLFLSHTRARKQAVRRQRWINFSCSTPSTGAFSLAPAATRGRLWCGAALAT